MKKLLKTSLIAMLVAVPMVAHAAGEPVDANDPLYAGVDATAVADVASTSYVKGAYNDAIGKINKVANLKQDNLTNGSAAVSSTVKTSVGAATGNDAAVDTALVTEKAVRDAIDAASSANATAYAGDGLVENNGTLDVNLATNSGLAITSDALSVDAGDGLQINQTDGSLEAKVDTTHITTSNGQLTLSATDIASLGKAESAIQSVAEGATDGTIAVDGTDVAVHGLGSAAFVNTGDLADTAGTYDHTTSGLTATTIQDAIDEIASTAGSAVQSVTEGSTNGTIDVDGTDVAVHGLGSAAFVNTGDLADTAGTYDNTDSGLTATTIQDAIDEVASSSAKYVTVHTVWNTNTTASANVLTATQQQ